MANSYTKAAFVLIVTAVEADLLEKAASAADLCNDRGPEDEERQAAFADLGPAFAAAFPPDAGDPFAGFLALFDDPDYPSFGCDIHAGDTDAAGRVSVYFGGDQFDPGATAELIRRACPSALPCGFEYALDCDRLRAGEFGGGYVVITADRVAYRGSSRGLDRALERARDEGADGFVLATRHREHGLSFWNHETGFGRLRDATVFSEAEAAQFDIPIADDEPEWLAMPAPMA